MYGVLLDILPSYLLRAINGRNYYGVRVSNCYGNRVGSSQEDKDLRVTELVQVENYQHGRIGYSSIYRAQ